MSHKLALLLTGAMFAASCSETPPAAAPQPAGQIAAASSLEGAHAAIRRATDQGNPAKRLVSDPNGGIRRIVVDLECPTDSIVTCGADGTRAAAIWLAANSAAWGSYPTDPVTHLLVNVGDGSTSGGFQLSGKMPPAGALDHATPGQVLEVFQWNGAGELGEIAVAKWCGSADASTTAQFCAAFFKDECSPVKAPEVVKACPADLLRRD